MSVLLIAEHDNSKLKPFTLNAITAASKIDGDVHVLVAGANCENVTKEVRDYVEDFVLKYRDDHYIVLCSHAFNKNFADLEFVEFFKAARHFPK